MAADILEIAVDAFGARGGELLGEIRSAVIDRRIEAEHVANESALVRTTRNADRARALDAGDLADGRADGAACGGHDDRLARLRLADRQQSCIGGEAGHAQNAERGRQRCRRRIELAQVRTARQRIALPAGMGEHEITVAEIRVARAHDAGNCAALHNRADLHRLGIGPAGVHAPAHVGIEREVEDFEQNLAFGRLRDCRLDDAEVARRRSPRWPGGQQNLGVRAHCLSFPMHGRICAGVPSDGRSIRACCGMKPNGGLPARSDAKMAPRARP
ncbi:hypothetical protein D9M70_476970 [compost metagenome]